MTTTITYQISTLHFRVWTYRLSLLLSMLFLSVWVLANGPPVNDACSTATVLTVGTSCEYIEYTLEDASLTGSPSSVCATNPKREVWFKASIPTSGVFVLRAKTNRNPIIAVTVFTGSCGSLVYYNCTNLLEPGTGHLSLSIQNAAMAGQDIYIEVTRGDSNIKGTFELCAFQQEKVSNENANDAILLTNEKGTFEHQKFTNKYALSSGQGGASCGSFQGADVWFKTEMPVSGRLVIHAKSEEIKPVIVLYAGGWDTANYRYCDQAEYNASLKYDETEIIYQDVSLAGETMYIRVYADGNGMGGDFELLVMELTQDFCSEAIEIDGNKSSEEFYCYNNKYATDSDDVNIPYCGSYDGADIWFVMEVPSSGELIIDTKASADYSVKPVLTLYSGSCSALTQISCAMFNSPNPFGGKIEISPTDNLANQTVYLRMHNYATDIGGAFDLSVHNPSAALPVELVRFTANTIESTVVLDWTTATEENNDYFLLEHSTDGQNFIPIEKIDGNGTTTELQQYTYVDDNPYFGENYYRLKQVDLDGAFEYHGTVVALVRLSEEQFKLFPNPSFTKDVITLRWSEGLGEEKLEVSISDALGRRVYQRELEDNFSRETSINCGAINLDAGIYFLQLSNESQVIAHRRFNLIGE